MEVQMCKKFNFYYDESEHSQKITEATLSCENYYDNFITCIVGWDTDNETALQNSYDKFETMFSNRKDKNGELKSTVMAQKDLSMVSHPLTNITLIFMTNY
jgi:hypothetical protein